MKSKFGYTKQNYVSEPLGPSARPPLSEPPVQKQTNIFSFSLTIHL